VDAQRNSVVGDGRTILSAEIDSHLASTQKSLWGVSHQRARRSWRKSSRLNEFRYHLGFALAFRDWRALIRIRPMRGADEWGLVTQ
jgi:hypothetical protein